MGFGAKLRRLALNGIGRAVTPWLKPVDGQTPDPVMSVIAAAGQQLESQVVRLPAVAARDAYRRSVLQAIDTRPSLAIVEDLTIGGRASRLYKPSDDSSSPLLVYYHGGGGVIGDLDTADLACRSLAEQSRWSVLSIDYRLGPEDPYPAALDDAVAGFRAAIDEAARLKVDPRQVAVGGESFGAMLAAQVCRRVRRDGGAPPVGQLLIYPVCDHGAQTPSR
ncbi:MAG: alpha/beta hydrolase fold domain-containing protein, partial [Myxococcota bacterium]